ncbi:hypothetical protein [Legionella feeleii]|uniref:Uncharacterized protein n=1 Tax=Legionella feeleii TaxID=453 RepID=A0A2X1QUN5_9GAMM|nr:hypothetical protein [Legionella feeleii]SPX62708.1 Uncharacterised protein [Legionella feeleii]
MSDPLGELENSLAYMFELQTKKTGKCIHPDVQRLKNALDNYKKGPSISLQELVTAVKQALPVIVNYGVELYVVKNENECFGRRKGLIYQLGSPDYTFSLSTSISICSVSKGS